MSFSTFTAISGVLAFASKVAAHGTVTGIVADGVYYEGYHADFQYMQTQPVVVGWSTPDDLSNGFIAPDAYNSSDIICHLNATNAKTSATVSAGGTVELQWTAWPDSHHGPVLDYLASCNGDCTTVDKTTLEFFKIDGVGLLDDNTVPGDWASDTLIANNNSWTVAIPSDIAPGNYVLRHEIIALHSAGTIDGAQNYPQCFNLQVTGSGSASPSGTLGTALYSETDPGIEINIYTSLSTYVVPGPTLYSGAISVSQTLPAAPTSIAPVGTVATSVTAGVTTSAAITSASLVTSSPSAGITSVAALQVSSGAPFSNGTSTASKKSKSACKSKSSKPVSTPAQALTSSISVEQVSTQTAAASTTLETIVPAMSTAPAATSGTSSPSVVSGSEPDASSSITIPAASSTSTADTTLPSGTTLNTLLSWISSFYNSVKGTEYDSNTAASVARRAHARAVVPRDFAQFDKVNVAATGTHGGFPHGTGAPHHHHHHPHGTGSAQPTGLVKRQQGAGPTGSFPGFPHGTGRPHHHHPHGTGTIGAAQPTGFERRQDKFAPTGSFPGFPHGTGVPHGTGRPHHHHPHGTGTGSARPTGLVRRQGSGAAAPSGTGAPHRHHHHHPSGTGAAIPTGSFPAGGALPSGFGGGKFRIAGGL